LNSMNKSMLDAAMLQLLTTQMLSQQQTAAATGTMTAKMNGYAGRSTNIDIYNFFLGYYLKYILLIVKSIVFCLRWRRQTCIRSIAASGVRGDVVYYAPCGKKLSTYAEVLRYLIKHPCNSICRDNFSFSSKLIVGEFLWPKELENGEKVNPVPDLPRVENLRLNGLGFADALMVCEFVHNFARVLEIDSSSLPSLSGLCAGLAGDIEHFDKVHQLALSLFRLSLEYPGLPSGKRSIFLDILHLLVLYLVKRGSRSLSHLLIAHNFNELAGEEKAAIMAFLCNELLCCPNIVKEIDRNLEEVGRLKGDRWMRDGKARALRVVQRKKQKAERGIIQPTDADGQTHDERPSSRNSEASDGSRPTTPIPTTRDRRLTPGLGQCEILTEEEENMTPDQLEVLIDSLNSEAEHLKEKINELSTKVRSFPLGCDRYHRQYWQIPGVPSVLVESVESSGVSNPACNTDDTCSKDPSDLTAPSFVHPDVFACVEDLVDDVVTGRSHTDRRKRKRFRRMDNPYKRGWWAVDTREALESVRSSLHGRGIRERILHRLLCKSWFLKDVKLGRGQCVEKCGKSSPQSREWFCPACVEVSTQVPTCLVCSRQHDYLATCRFFLSIFLFAFLLFFSLQGTSNHCTWPACLFVYARLHFFSQYSLVLVFEREFFRAMLDELECQPGVGPFLEPVDLDLVPGYRETIANPIDIASIRNRIDALCYETPDDFAADMELMFSNCRTFNEDDSPVGIAGATLQKFYHKRWRQLKYNFSKRLKRMRHSL
uniref:Bromo domain-containing protein n=1 Tax=Angiostrongylus cantonensis TaxID=6313 RepID=A0A158P7H3_ANGCA